MDNEMLGLSRLTTWVCVCEYMYIYKQILNDINDLIKNYSDKNFTFADFFLSLF